MSQRTSRVQMQLAPIPTFPRKQGKEFFIPSSACGGGLGWGRNSIHVTSDFSYSLTLTQLLWEREWDLVRADAVIR